MTRQQALRRDLGFTLIELMVSIALVLILVLGINQVFRIATDSVGAGQAISDTVRDQRGVQTLLFTDFQQSLIRSADSPAFVIRSTRASAFLDAEDEASDRDYAAAAGTTANAVDTAILSIDLDGDNTEGEAAVTGENVPRHVYGTRNFRTDVMSFFVRHLYPRQTGGGVTPAGQAVDQYVADMTSNEAWVWYGHLRQPQDQYNTAAVNMNPGWEPVRATDPPETSQSNPNNFYARRWALGRVAVLLREPVPGAAANTFVIADKAGNYQRYIWRKPTANDGSTAPLSGENPFSNAPELKATATINGNTDDPTVEMHHSRYDLAGTSIDQFRLLLRDVVIPANPTGWFDGTNMTLRFAGYPNPTNPISSYGAARTVPWLVGGCTSFMVEYAGDYLTQADNGNITGNYTGAAPTDGKTDFIVDGTGPTATRRIRWYGMPRDVTGDGVVTLADVVPLQAFVPNAIHEHQVGINSGANWTLNVGAEYAAAWGPTGSYGGNPEPPRPTMIRVTMTIDDPGRRLPAGTTYEYVIELP